MPPTCSFCGEEFPEGRLACPHCGSDAETGWKPEEPAEGLDLPAEMDEEDYDAFLKEEGLDGESSGVPPGTILAALFLLALAAVLIVLLG